MRRVLKVILLSAYDAFNKDFSYHASALSLQLLLVFSPFVIFITSILSYFPIFNLERIETYIEKTVPEKASVIIKEIFKVKKHSKTASIVSILISYFFAVGFLKKFKRAFSYIAPEKTREPPEFFYWIYLPFIFFVFGLFISLTFPVSVALKVLLKGYLKFIYDFVATFPLFILLVIFYTTFLKVKAKKFLLFSSFFIYILLIILNFLFTFYASYIFKGSILYGSLSSLVLFFIWLNLNFLLVLLGARMIYRYEKEN